VPSAPANLYRKRPVKLIYDKNEYHMFKLPSEQSFEMNGFDLEDVFGARKGMTHSPHIRAQMDMDSNIVWVMALVTVAAVTIENGRSHKYVTLRENMVNSDKGWFSVEDFN
jgi:hypothetical protein